MTTTDIIWSPGPGTLDSPLSWRANHHVLVEPLADPFGPRVVDALLAGIWTRIFWTSTDGRCRGRASDKPTHTYQITTTEPDRAASFLTAWADPTERHAMIDAAVQLGWADHDDQQHADIMPAVLPNVWLGVPIATQDDADRLLPDLLRIPTVARYAALTLVGPVDLECCAWTPPAREGWPGVHNPLTGEWWPAVGDQAEESRDRWTDQPRLDWVTARGGSDPVHPDWVRRVRDQATAAGIPFEFTSWGNWAPVGPLYELDDPDAEDADDAHMDAVHLEVVEHKQVIHLERTGHIAGDHQPGDPRTWLMARVGKKRAGRELDGQTWTQRPTRVPEPAGGAR